MFIIKPVIICIITLVISLTLKNIVPQFVPVIILCSGVLVFFYILPYIKSILDMTSYFNNDSEINKYIELIIKIVIIAVICEFSSQLCSDSGENYLSKLILFSGKLIILSMISPYIIIFIKTILEYLKEI